MDRDAFILNLIRMAETLEKQARTLRSLASLLRHPHGVRM